mmetsp:Transcript_8345/g.13061  ORF Transcript_8345/g.13061 Transcript_8345/m.13061 type:complete len:461 (-) Transcript_8345:78-1460(-)
MKFPVKGLHISNTPRLDLFPSKSGLPSIMLSNNKNDNIDKDSHDNFENDTSEGKSPGPSKSSRKKAARGPSAAKKYKKAPDAPRRFKSAFIFFSIEKHREIRENLENDGQKEKTTNVAKMVSEAWKGLNKEERDVWEEKARRDRARYEVEVANYKGPWKVPAKRLKKPKGAPKKPTSAFLCFSNKRRVETMRSNPNLSQARISALLSKMWNEAPEEVRDTYIKQELFKRENYKKAIAAWRENEKLEKTKERAEREAEALAKVAELEVSASDSVSAMSAALNMHSAVASLQQNAPQLSVYFALQQQQQSQQQQQPSLSYAQDVARAAREHNTLQQLSNAHMRQQETLEKLMFANIASNLGYASAPSQSFASNLGLPQGLSQGLAQGLSQGLPPQLNFAGFGGSTVGDSSALVNAQHQLQQQLGMSSMMGLDPSSLLNLQAFSEGGDDGGGGTDWTDFPIGE